MAQAADAVVVGGGIIGASTFFHLASLGLARVVLCDDGRPEMNATVASGGFIQYHFCRNEPETRLTQASLPYFERWDELVSAGSSGFSPCGYLRLEPAQRVEGLRQRAAMLQGLGVDTRVIGPDDVAALAPYLNVDGVEIAVWEPKSGYADIEQPLAGFLQAGQRVGGEVQRGTSVTGLRQRGGAVAGVDTSDGPIDAPLVVIAAGVGSRSLLQGTGLDLPLEHFLTQWIGFAVDDLPERIMTVGDGVSGSYFRPAGHGQLLLGLGGVGRRPFTDAGGTAAIPSALVETAGERLAARLSTAGGIRHTGGMSGPVVLTPDDLPIIDRHPGIDGLFFFAGDGGASFKTAPAIGRALAEWAVNGRAEVVDVTPFALSRFSSAP